MTELADCIENREKAAAAEKGAEKRIVKMFRAFRVVPMQEHEVGGALLHVTIGSLNVEQLYTSAYTRSSGLRKRRHRAPLHAPPRSRLFPFISVMIARSNVDLSFRGPGQALYRHSQGE